MIYVVLVSGPTAFLRIFLVFWLWLKLCFPLCCIVLTSREFSAEESNRPVVLSNDRSRPISIIIKPFWKIRAGQGHIFGNSGHNIIKRFLVYLFPMSRCFSDIEPFGCFGMTTLADKACEWGKHFAAPYLKILTVLDHAKKSTEVFDVFGQC